MRTAAVEATCEALERHVPVSGILGYLNFSDGRPDPRWQKQLNDAFAFLAQRGEPAPWEALLRCLRLCLDRLHASGSGAFRDITQAAAVLGTAQQVLPAYRAHHADLLAHCTDAELFGPLFLARVLEAVLARRAAEGNHPSVASVLARLNDYVGHRPIAILETRPQGEPYDHERHRPVPLYLRDAGVAFGPTQLVVERTLEILRRTPPGLLAEAQLDLKLLDELAVDMRAYDHNHPANRRPNYVFGEWDPHHLDNQGRFRRYVIRKITLDALMERVLNPGELNPDEAVWEGAAVLAGTILMAVGVSGASPTAHDSSTTLAVLLPRIARYRDAFYQHLLPQMSPPHAERLRREQETTRQPFGAARQHLNAALARHRALQLQQRYLTLLFAEMGYPEASREEAGRIPAVSVRLVSEILGRLTSGQHEADQGKLAVAAQRLPEVEALLRRGIACGAFADPWNILGFQGLYPLSPAREDSVRDTRLDELVQMVEQTFLLYARLMSEGAAAGQGALVQTLQADMRRLAEWWDRFATYEVNDVRRVHGGEAHSSAAHVAQTLQEWHERDPEAGPLRGGATADLAFWRDRFDRFRTPKAFALVVEALLRKHDYRAAMALLTSWLGQVEQVPLEDGPHSFHTLALRWMLALTRQDLAGKPREPETDTLPTPQRRQLVERFFAFLEANAEDYWQVPHLEVLGMPREVDAEDEGDEDLFGAAYDEVTYRDTTDREGGAVDEGDEATREPFDLEEEGERLEKRLRFLSTVARLWQVASRYLAGVRGESAGEPGASAPGAASPAAPGAEPPHELLDDWLKQARDKQQRLLTLLDAIHAHPIPEPTGEYESLVEYDRRRVMKEQLVYTTIGTCLDMALAVAALQGVCAELGARSSELGTPEFRTPSSEPRAASWEALAIQLEQALFQGDADRVRATLVPFVEQFRNEPLLFTPLTEGGSPRQILRVRIAQTILRALLANLPRLGLLRESYDLLRTARSMEQNNRTFRGRGVTEFNHFFQTAYQAVVESVIESAPGWPAEAATDDALVKLLERLTGPFLVLWMEHSRTLQLSVLESVVGEREWQGLREFIRRYGGDLFHARFLALGNLRGILHRGVGPWLDSLQEQPDPLRPVRLLEDIGSAIRREDAVRRLEVVLQAVVENYEEYKDYNATTTQSDYGENLFGLLEFLRLKTAYERQAWQMRPLVLAHEVLARRGRNSAAVRWEESLTHYTQAIAQQHLDQLAKLEQVRGMRLGTVRDRIGERFIKPLALDRLCALIEPAMLDAQKRTDEPESASTAFERLRQELLAYTVAPTGVGLDVPYWLRRLEMEVHRVQASHTTIAVLAEHFFRVPRRAVAYDELQRQLDAWEIPALPR